MACKASKAPFLRIITKRGFAASVCPRPLGQVAEIQQTVLPNKLIVASAPSSLPVTRVSIVFRAGARNETYESLGSTHLLRIATGLTTRNATGFAITRNIQQIGGSLTCTTDRETVTYTLETTSNHINTGLRFLQDVVQPLFKPWEIADSTPRVKYQVAAIPPQVRAVELLHKAAFRSGLGNSVYIPKFQIGKLSSETLQHYVAKNFTSGRAAVVGVGIDQNSLSGFAQSLELPNGSGSTNSTNYYGGDARKDTAGQISHVAVAGRGAGLSNLSESIAFAVLERAVGLGAVTKRGNVNGAFGKALQSAVGDAKVSYAPLNVSYSDAGLFGFVVSTDSDNICKAVDSLSRALKSGSVSAEDVQRGKAVLKSNILETYSTDSGLINELGQHAALIEKVHSADALIALVDEVTQQQVQAAAKKAGSSPLSVGAVGNLANVPYASELA